MIDRNHFVTASFLALKTMPTLSICQESPSPLLVGATRAYTPVDFNTDIYYRNKLEFSQEVGVLPINIPFVFDIFVGGDYSQA
jgi:hypothetical protein